jgi:hypothetical protein
MDLFNTLDVKGAIELAAAATTALGALGSLIYAGKRGIGPGTIKLAGAVMIIPIVLILALEKTLEPATLGTVIGAVLGFVLSGVGGGPAAPVPTKDTGDSA